MNTLANAVKSFLADILGIAVIVFLLISLESYLNHCGFIPGENPMSQIILETNEKIAAASLKVEQKKRKLARIDEKIEQREESVREWVGKVEEKGAWKTLKNSRFYIPLMKARFIEIPELHIKRLEVLADLSEDEKDVAGLQEKCDAAKNPAFLDYWKQNFRHHVLWYTVITAFFVFLSPLLWSLFFYYCVGWLVEKIAPIHPDSGSTAPKIRLMGADAIIKVKVHAGEKILLRGGWCKDRTGVNAKTKILWRWGYPLVSLAADLCELVVFSKKGEKDGSISITAPYEDMFIGQLDLNGGELVIRPKYLVGVSDSVQIKTKWNWSLHNILSGRIRQVILYGTGQVFIAGSWGVEQNAEDIGQDHRIEREMLLGYDYSSHYSLCRTETFWHYFRGKASLFDVKIQHGTFLTQNNTWSLIRPVKGPLEKLLNVLLNGIGGLLGF